MGERGALERLRLKYFKPLPDFKHFKVNILGFGHLATAFIGYGSLVVAVAVLVGVVSSRDNPDMLNPGGGGEELECQNGGCLHRKLKSRTLHVRVQTERRCVRPIQRNVERGVSIRTHIHHTRT